MEIFLCITKRNLVSQLNDFILENNLIAISNSSEIVERINDAELPDRDLNLLIADKNNKPGNSDIPGSDLTYIESKIHFVHIQQLKPKEKNKIISTRISWLPEKSNVAKKLGASIKKYFSKKNHLGMKALKGEQAYLNKTLAKKYFWSEEVGSGEFELYDWLGTVRIVPSNKN